MQLYADIYDPTGVTKLGTRQLMLIDATITRALDGAGSFNFTVPALDSNALAVLQNKRRVRIFIQHESAARELGRGVIETVQRDDAGSKQIRVSGPDEIAYLKYKNTGLARSYNGATVSAAMTALTGLAGWTASGTNTNTVSMRFNGESVLKAVQTLTEQQGIHFRNGSTVGQIEFGVFGADSGLRAMRTEVGIEREAELNDALIWIEDLALTTDSKDIYNYLIPLGGGEGEAALTLEKSTRTTPYTVQTGTRPDGRTFWFLSASSSISAYGQIEKVGTFKNIAPLSNTDADIQNAANALYDATAAYLQRYAVPLDSYTLTAKKGRATLKPGDKIRVVYKGEIATDEGALVWRDINALFWVMEVSERHGTTGDSWSLKIATVDRVEQDIAQVIIGAIDDIELNNIIVQTYPTVAPYVYQRDIAPSYPARIPVRVTDAVFKLNRCNIRLKTAPFRSNVTGGAAGGNHDHVIFAANNISPLPAYTTRNYIFNTQSSAANVGLQVNGAYDQVRTYTASGDHTHAALYGIFDDTDTPTGLQIWVNGIDRTAALGGPFAVSPGAITIDLNAGLITGYLNTASGGLRQEHTVEVRCTGGKGRIEAIVELYEIIQAIAVT